MKTLSKKEKELWNEAVRKTLNEVKLYDGIIVDDNERDYLAHKVYERIAYDSENPFQHIRLPFEVKNSHQ